METTERLAKQNKKLFLSRTIRFHSSVKVLKEKWKSEREWMLDFRHISRFRIKTN